MAVLAQLIDGVVANRFELESDKLSLGRHPANNIQIDDDAVSSQHAVITQQANADFKEYSEFYLEDLGSTNGTFVNDAKIKGKVRLHNNDVIRLAWNKFRFIDESTGQMDKTVHMITDM